VVKKHLIVLLSTFLLPVTFLVPTAPAAGAAPSTTAKAVPPKPIPAANSACTKMGEVRSAPNVIFKCAIVGRKLTWQRMSVEAQKISSDKLYKAPPPLKTQSPALNVVASAKSSRVGVPISLQTQGGAGKGIVSFIPSGNGCYIIGYNLFATIAGFCGVIAKKDGDETYNPGYSTYSQYNFEGQDSGALLISNTKLSNTVGTAVTLTTSGGNGNPVIKFGTSNKDCSIEGNILTTTKRTSCYVVASQDQSGQYKFTTSAAVGFDFASVQAKLQISTPNSTLGYGNSISIETLGGSGTGEVTFRVSGQGCLIVGRTLTANARTSCVVIAKKAADNTFIETYSAAAVFTFLAIPKPVDNSKLTFAITNQQTESTVNQRIRLTTIGGAVGAVSYSVTSGNCSLTDAFLASNVATTCSVVAILKPSDSTLKIVTSEPVTFVFSEVASPLLITNPNRLGRVGQTINLIASGGNGNPITFSVTSAEANGCTVSGSILKGLLATSCVVTALQDSSGGTSTVFSPAVTFTFTKP